MTTENNKYDDIIENLPGILHHGDNMLIVLSSGPLMVNYLGDSALCISGVAPEEQAALFNAIEAATEFRVTDWHGTPGIYVPHQCKDIGTVAELVDAGRTLFQKEVSRREEKKALLGDAAKYLGNGICRPLINVTETK